MAFKEKDNDNDWTGANGWVGGVVPNTQDVAYLGPNTTLTAVSQGTGTLNASCVSMEENSGTTSFIASSNGAVNTSSFITRIGRRNPTQGGNSQYSVFVGTSRSLSINGLVDFISTYTTQHFVYVSSGASFIVSNGNGNAYGGGWVANSTSATGGVRIYKQGPGIFQFGNNINPSPPTTTQMRGGFTIQDGAIWVGGFQPLNESLGVSGFDNTLEFNASPGGNPEFRFLFLGLPSESTTRTVTVPVLMTTNGTITAGSYLLDVTLTMTGAATGSGTLTIARERNSPVVWNNNISCPINVTGWLTVGTNYGLYGTISGPAAGVITFSGSGSSINATAPSFLGTVNGSFAFMGYNRVFGGIIGGTCTLGSTYQVTCTNTGTNPGAIGDVQANSTFTFKGLFNASSGTTQVFSGAKLIFDGPSANINPGRGLSVFGNASAHFVGGTNVTTGFGYAWDTDTDSYLVSDDANTNTVSGTIYTDIWNVGTPVISTMQIRSKANGTLVIAGTIAAFGSAGRYRLLNINGGSGDTSAYTGRVKITGNVTSPSPLVLTKGELEVGSDSVTIAGGVTVNGGKLILPPKSNTFRKFNQSCTLAAGTTVNF